MKQALLILILGMIAFSEAASQEEATTMTKLGQEAPAFICTTLDGKTIDIKKLRGKVIMINFFATWCPGCNLELPELQKTIWEKYRNNDKFVLVVIGREHSDKELSEYAALKGLSLPFAPDPKREIYNLYASKYIPRNVVIDREGKIIYQKSGFTAAELAGIEKLISENLT